MAQYDFIPEKLLLSAKHSSVTSTSAAVMVSVKANKDGDIRRFVLPDGADYVQLRTQLGSVYSFSQFTIKYKDDEGDLVTLSSDDELEEAIALAGTGGLLRVQVIPTVVDNPAQNVGATTSDGSFAPSPNVPIAASDAAPGALPNVPQARQPETEPASGSIPNPFQSRFPAGSGSGGAGPSSRPNPSSGTNGNFIPEQVRERLSSYYNMLSPESVLSLLMGGMRGGGGGSGDGRAPEAGPSERARISGWEGRGSDWLRAFNVREEDIGNFLRDFNLHTLGGEFRSISQGTMEAFRTLMTSLMRTPGAMALMSAMPIALPAIRAFVAELQAGVPVTTERIDALAGVLALALSGPLGSENARRIADFARSAARDETVLNLLRRVSNVGATWASNAANAARNAGNVGNDAVRRVHLAMARSGRLDVHENARCFACNSGPIIGVRFICQSDNARDLCAECFANDNVSKEAFVYRGIEYPWEVAEGRALVPHPVLAFGSQGVEVMFLQKLLTDLGYLQASDYRVRAGVYGPCTADAVNRLRSDCGLRTHGTYGMYDDIAAASLLSVIEARVPPGAASGQPQQSDSPNPPSTDNTPAAA